MILLLYLLSNCGGGGVGQGTATTAPTTTPQPSGSSVGVSLVIDSPTTLVGQTAIVTWSATNATSCIASDAWSGTLSPAGAKRVAIGSAGKNRFAITCTSTIDGNQASAEATTVATAPALLLRQSYNSRANTIATSEGAPYGDTDFWLSNDYMVSNFGYGPTKVQRLYICLSGMVSMSDCSAQASPTGPLSATMLAGIDSGIARFAGSGKRLIVRFVYNLGPIGSGARDVPAALIATHIDQLAPILLKHQDMIFALQAGFIGTWGEWHDSTSGNTTLAVRNQIIDRLLLHFRGHFPILLRYPGQMIEYLGTTVAPSDLGLHDDYFASDDTDGGTWAGYNNPSVTSATVLRNFTADVATTTMFVGEFGALYPQLQSCAQLDIYSQQFHPQSIALEVWPTTVGTTLQANGCVLQFFNKVGTRIEIQSALLLARSGTNAPLRVELALVNTGYGRVIRARPVTLVLSRGNSEVSRTTIPLAQLDLRELKAGFGPQVFAFDLNVPVDIGLAAAAGALTASLWIPDSAASLTPQPTYALPLNSVAGTSQDVFLPATGLNQLGNILLQ
jgi:hypothetical protein